MNDKLTVLIPTSPIPSHPSTAILDETIVNIRKYTDAKIILLCDGVHESLRQREDNYRAYLQAVHENVTYKKYGNADIVLFSVHNHQSGMTRWILQEIETPLICFCEHDTSPIGEIPWQRICDLVLYSREINCMRFNIFDRIPDEHEYLMLKEYYEDSVKYRRTIQWSQRPHIAKTDWYRNILTDYFTRDQKSMIEDIMHSVVQSEYDQKGKDEFGLAIYTPDGNQLRSYHSDARGSDEKIIYG